MTETAWLPANWPAPNWVRAGITTRVSGFSQVPYSSLNMANHVQDQIEVVEKNRQKIQQLLRLPSQPIWLNQTHSEQIINVDENLDSLDADGAYTKRDNMVVCVLTADCLPLLLCDTKNKRVAAIHVGWRGFSKGIVTKAMEPFSDNPGSVMAWMGPCISSENYEISEEVREICLMQGNEYSSAFYSNRPGHYLADLRHLVRINLHSHGIKKIYTTDICTYADKETWFSYRRDGQTGRMASLIWMGNNK